MRARGDGTCGDRAGRETRALGEGEGGGGDLPTPVRCDSPVLREEGEGAGEVGAHVIVQKVAEQRSHALCTVVQLRVLGTVAVQSDVQNDN